VPKFLRMADQTAVDLKNFVTGSNESGYHTVGGNWDKEFIPAQASGGCAQGPGGRSRRARFRQTLQTARGIEIGHIFQLGTKYSQALGATYTSETGEESPWNGLLRGRRVAAGPGGGGAVLRQKWDYLAGGDRPLPRHRGDSQHGRRTPGGNCGTSLYAELNAAGVETLLDDRDERAGVKFKDADLIGIPFRIVTGRSLKNGKVEVVQRASGESQEVAVEDVVSLVQGWVDAALGR
jgi:prolyl-tRNA synthetase